MKKILVLILTLYCSIAFSAARYWVGNAAFLGLSNNWSYNSGGVTNWGSASGVVDNVAPPTSSDDVTFDGAGLYGNQNSTISATITVLSLTITSGYTATMTHSAVLTIAGDWNYQNAYTIAGSSAVTVSAASTITSNGKTWPNAVSFSGSNTKVISGAWTVTGALTCSTATTTITLNGGNVSFGGLTISGTTVINKTASETFTSSSGQAINAAMTGTAEIILTGGTWSGSNTTGIANNLTIQGNVTVSGNVYYRTGILKYTSGTPVVTSSVLNLTGTCTLNTTGMSWNNCTITVASQTFTLTSNFSMSGLLSMNIGITTTINKTASETFTIAGGISHDNLCGGSAEIILTGGTWSTGANSGSSIGNNLTFAGNVTLGTRSGYKTGILKYTSGTITATGNTLIFCGSATVNTNGMTWNNWSSSSSATLTLTSNASLTGSLAVPSQNMTLTPTVSETVTVGGGITLGLNLLGTAQVIWTGGTWTAATNISIKTPLRIQGNVTVSGAVYYEGNTLSYASGTPTTTGSTLTLNQSTTSTIDTNGMTWNNVTVQTANTVTINSLFSISGTLSCSIGATFTGTSGWTCGTFNAGLTSSGAITLKESVTYTITTSFLAYQSSVGSTMIFTSAHAVTKAILTLRNPSACNVLANFIRIDASGGRTIPTFNGTITDCLNIRELHDLQGVATAN